MTFTDFMTAADINKTETLLRFSGNIALLERFMRRFAQDPTHAALNKAIHEGNMDEAYSAAHTLKGITGNLGMNTLFAHCDAIVSAYRAEQMEKIPTLAHDLTLEYNRIVTLLAQLDETPA